MNKLILGDNLEIMRSMAEESVDLIYLDPPFFSNRNYEVIWGDDGEVRSFQDRWAGGMDHYIAWLKERVEAMFRLLKPTGSIFLHCDWHADAYIRVDILDKIFGASNFRNHIVWKRTTGSNSSVHHAKQFGNMFDSIYFYSKSNEWTYEQLYSFDDPNYLHYIETNFSSEDENGRKFRSADLSNPAPRPNLMYDYKGYKHPKNGWAISKEKMELWDKEGRLLFPENKNGRIRRKVFLDELKGKPIQNMWDDISMVTATSKERIGYPTQKPEALLERIIQSASHEGDVIFDPFMGGGTTIAVADRLNRQWIGIDQSVQAVKVTEFRLNRQQDLLSKPFTVQLHKYDYDVLRYKDAFEFEKWIIQQMGGVPNTKQRNDLGLDGKSADGSPIQVKRSENIGRNVVDNFKSAIERSDKKRYNKAIANKSSVGTIIAFSFGKGAIEEVARLKKKENLLIILRTVEEIVPLAKKPNLTFSIADQRQKIKDDKTNKAEKGEWEIDFVAQAQSEAGIEFYAWDFNFNTEEGFKPMVLIDKEGKQTHSFKAGTHSIAVKAVDNDGLDSVETLRLKINGTVISE